ncbi:MAG: acyl-CoA/acyl-ACP dehydrogenase [Geminicoccaceae bacterium]|nr:acyl-CoA/acyl-ACP dehydrogenase [Geminicoccaceae bacterium]
MEIEIGEDFSELREAVARLCEPFDDHYWQDLDKRAAYPEEFVRALSEGGFLGCLIPEEHGGSGLSLRAATVILETIHRSGCNAAACHAQMYIMGTLLRHGSPQQKAAYLPGIASGEIRLQAFGVTEPTSGTDTSSLKTRALRKGDRWIVNGQKVWTSRALQSDLMLLLARTTPIEDVKRRSDGLSIFLVDLRQVLGKGLDIRPIDAMINHNTNEIFMSDMELPVDALVGEEGRGFRYILDGMNAERILIASECIGDARWFLDRATAYANERQIFGRPIGQNQGIQFPLARAHAETEAADLMVRKAAGLFDAGEAPGAEANMAKLLASEASWHAGEAAMQTHGGFAFASEYAIERKWRETRLYQIAPISTNLILAFIAHQVLGLPKSY